MKTEYIVLNQERNVSLTAYLQPAGGEFAGVDRRPAGVITLRAGLQYIRMSSEAMEALEQRLRTIENIREE